MYKVGLTGNIASGKSSVARVWQELGARVVDADVLARRAVEPGSPALASIVERWGHGMLDESGGLDRGAMRALVFADPSARAELEDIVHPRVAELRDEEFAAAERAGQRVVAADIPLLFEAGLEGDFDLIVLVDAPAPLRQRRMVRDRGLDPEEANRMIAAQMPADRKRSRADIVIDNTGSIDELREAAGAAWEEITRRAGASA